MDLTPREQDVLLTIIEAYIDTAKPVASRTVVKRSGLGLSAATMRAVMADLTDKGLLEQPHTSAGRAPTPAAFRYYVDKLLELMPPSRDLRNRLESRLEAGSADVGELLRRSGQILADAARQVSMVVAPSYGAVRLKQLDFVRVKPGLVLAIQVLDGGIVRQKLIEPEHDATPDELVSYANYVTDRFSGMSLADIRAAMVRELNKDFSRLGRHALAMADRALTPSGSQEVYVDGAAHILMDGADAASVREVLNLLGERTRLVEILDKVMHEGAVAVTLGSGLAPLSPLAPRQTAAVPFGDLSLVSSPYALDGQTLGVVGVLGPLRMDYATVVPTVEVMAAIITNMLHKRF